MKNSGSTKKNSSKLVLFTVISTALILSFLLVFGLLEDNGIITSENFSSGTSINGVNVSGMRASEAAGLVSSKMQEELKQTEITLTSGERSWMLNGNDFKTNGNIFPAILKTFNSAKSGNGIKKLSNIGKIKKEQIDYQISYRNFFSDFDDKIDSIASEINVAPTEPEVVFDPNGENMFSIKSGEVGYELDKEKLYEEIDNAFKGAKKISVEIPVKEIDCVSSGEELLANTALRSKFQTNYSTSASGRKNNVKRALSDFNGMSVLPGEEVSFNDVTGDKTPEKGYMKANVILNGIYVEDYGGGACQASTTLYNAVLLADLEVLEVHPHSIPASYVPLSFDAMVSEGTSDMRFKNSSSSPIYIKTYGDDTNVYVEIYGEPLEEGVEIKERTEFVETLPHSGDVIVKDEEGKYADKVTYEGEYFRLKKPQEGYHAKAYLDYYRDGVKQAEKLIRDEIYQPQTGIIVEGAETLGEGMTLPETDVKIIPPEGKTNISEESVKNKINVENPASLNP